MTTGRETNSKQQVSKRERERESKQRERERGTDVTKCVTVASLQAKGCSPPTKKDPDFCKDRAVLQFVGFLGKGKGSVCGCLCTHVHTECDAQGNSGCC